MTAAEQLIAAVRAGDAERVRALVEEDRALAAATDEEGAPAVRVALYHRQRAVLDVLLEAEPPLEDPDVAAVGDVRELRRRLARDAALVRARTPDGFTPLHFAAFFGGVDAVDALLDAGADPNVVAENPTRVRPLHSAAAARDVAAAERLLAGGADPDARQQGGFTALHAAAQHDDEELAAALLRHGADPNIRTDDGADAAAMAEAKDATAVMALLGVPEG
jgi:ankyrin repeat protein